MTNSESVNEYRVVAIGLHVFPMLDNANSEVNVMKFNALETVPIPYILPFVQTELRDTRHKFTC